MASTVFSVSITYNPDIELLDRQIDSLLDQVQCIVIVDNGSRNVEFLKEYLERKQREVNHIFIVVYNAKNMGLGYSQNAGIKVAINKGATDVLLLDQDSVLQGGFIKNLIETRAQLEAEHVRIGAMGPVYYNERTNQTYPITKYWGPFIQKLKTKEKAVEVSYLISSGCFISTNVIKDIGLMNEDLFIDCIDIDWSFRAQARGYKLYASPKAIMMHIVGEERLSIGGRSIAVHSPLRRYYLFRNSVFMVRSENIPLGYKVREIVFNTLRLVVYFSVSKDRMKYLKYGISGFRDGLSGKGGECTHKF